MHPCLFENKYPAPRRTRRPARTARVEEVATTKTDSQIPKRMVHQRLSIVATQPAGAELMAELAHDLCSPLSTISVIARTLRENCVSGDEEENLDAIVRISERAIGLVRDVLDQARIEAGREVARMGICDLHELVEDVVEANRRRARDGNVEFRVLMNTELPQLVRTDGLRLRRVLGNVLDNAFKYTRRGAITLSVDAKGGTAPGDMRLIFEIRDTGIGIPLGDQTRIFERFVRLPGTNGTTGAGLGLAIASQMTKLLGGTIHVVSVPGEGSCFRIEVPAEPGNAKAR